MVDVDHNANIERIVSNIKKDETLYDSGKTPGKLRRVLTSVPPNNVKKSGMMPYAYVSLPAAAQSGSNEFGSAYESNLAAIFNYKIDIISHHIDTGKSESQLRDLVKNMRNFFNANPRQTLNGSDPIFGRSKIVNSSYDPNTQGKTIQYATITLEVLIGDVTSLVVPAVGELYVLEETGGYGWETEDSIDDDGERDIVPIVLTGSKFYKIETNPGITAKIEAVIQSAELVTITFNRGATQIQYPVFIKKISPSIQIRWMEVAVIEIERAKSS